MTRPQFSMSFNPGQVVQMGGLMIAVMVGRMQLEARTSLNPVRIAAVDMSDAWDRPHGAATGSRWPDAASGTPR